MDSSNPSMFRVRLFTSFLCTVICFFNSFKCIGQARFNFPSDLEAANNSIDLPVQQVNLDSFRLVARQDMPLMVSERIEQIYYSFDTPSNYSFLGLPVEKIQISLDLDSMVTALYFIVNHSEELLSAALKRFGEESQGWIVETSLSSPDALVPYYHFWRTGALNLTFSDMLTVENIRTTQNKKIVVCFKKSIKDYSKQ